MKQTNKQQPVCRMNSKKPLTFTIYFWFIIQKIDLVISQGFTRKIICIAPLSE